MRVTPHRGANPWQSRWIRPELHCPESGRGPHCNHPDRIQITFDDRRLVANAGLILPATLARRLGLPELVHNHLDLGRAPGRANTGDKMMTLVASALAGGDCIVDADAFALAGRPALSAAWSRRPPPWGLRWYPKTRQLAKRESSS